METLYDRSEEYREWIRVLDEEVIQCEFGYEPGEFTIYTSHWQQLFEQGLTPRQAWQRALDGHKNSPEFARIIDGEGI